MKEIRGDQKLHIEVQSSKKLQFGGFCLYTNEIERLTYDEYVKYAKGEMVKYFGNRNPSIDEIENLYWKNILTESKYGCNNEMSLFGDNVHFWNLDRFTSKESNIHSQQTHHNDKVRISFINFSQCL